MLFETPPPIQGVFLARDFARWPNMARPGLKNSILFSFFEAIFSKNSTVSSGGLEIGFSF